MAAPAYLLDTNILLRLSLPGGPYDDVVVSAVGRLVAEGATLFYTLQNAAEFWSVCTRPSERNGLGLPPRETDRRLRLIEQQFLFLPVTGFFCWIVLKIRLAATLDLPPPVLAPISTMLPPHIGTHLRKLSCKKSMPFLAPSK